MLDARARRSRPRMLATFGVAAPRRPCPSLQDALQYPSAQHPRPGERVRRRRRAHHHPGHGDRRDRHPPGEGNAAPSTIAEDVRAHPQSRGTTWSTADPTTRRARASEDRQRSARRETARTPSAPRRSICRSRAAWRRAMQDVFGEPPVQMRTHRRHRADRAVHRRARLPGGLRADGELRQQPARGEREPAARPLLPRHRDDRRGADDVSQARRPRCLDERPHREDDVAERQQSHHRLRRNRGGARGRAVQHLADAPATPAMLPRKPSSGATSTAACIACMRTPSVRASRPASDQQHTERGKQMSAVRLTAPVSA